MRGINPQCLIIVRLYTFGSAFASLDEQIKGTIEPGKLADLVLLSEDILFDRSGADPRGEGCVDRV